MKNNFYRKLLNLELLELGLVTRTNLFTNADKIYEAISKNQAKIVMISYLSQILATSAKVLGTELCFKLFLRFFSIFSNFIKSPNLAAHVATCKQCHCTFSTRYEVSL